MDGQSNVGSRCIAIGSDNIVHIVFAAPGSRIEGDSNYELYYITFPIEHSTLVGDPQNIQIPRVFALQQNYPNPFNPSTNIRYSIPQSSNVVIKVFDILGNEIETLVNEEKPVGSYEVDFNASELSSGIYFYKLQAGEFIQTKKMIILK